MVRCNCLVCSMPYGNSVLLVMQCVVAFTWCIQSFPSSYIPLLDSSSDGVNRMCSCVILFFFLFMVLVVLARLVFLSGLESALGYSLLSSASNCYSFVPTNSIQATSKKKNAHFRFPLLILHISPRNFACHRQVQVTNACPNSVMSDLTSRKADLHAP